MRAEMKYEMQYMQMYSMRRENSRVSLGARFGTCVFSFSFLFLEREPLFASPCEATIVLRYCVMKGNRERRRLSDMGMYY